MNPREEIAKAQIEKIAAINAYNQKIKEIQLSCDHPFEQTICFWEQNEYLYYSPLLICKCCGYTEEQDGLFHHPSFQKIRHKVELSLDRECMAWSVGKIKNQRLLFEVYHRGQPIDILFD